MAGAVQAAEKPPEVELGTIHFVSIGLRQWRDAAVSTTCQVASRPMPRAPMNWSDKFTSFPAIACASLLAALLLGVVFGLMGPSPRPVPAGGETTFESAPKTEGVKVGQARQDRRERAPGDLSPEAREGAKPAQGSATGQPGTGPGKSPTPRDRGEVSGAVWSRPKVLKEGPKHDLQSQITLPVPQGAILVSVKTGEDYSVNQATLRLEIQAEGLGWQPMTNRPRTGSAGAEYRFDGLFPGQYRVTCATPGFAEVSEEVRLIGGIQEVQVQFRISASRYTRVHFAFEFEDGGKPEQVIVQRAERGTHDGTTEGRFNRYGAATIELGAVNSSSMAYVIPPETGVLTVPLRVGMRERFIFSQAREGKRYRAEMEVTGKDNEEQRQDVVLKLLPKDAPDPGAGLIPRDPVRMDVSFTRSDGAAVKLRRCNLRQSLDAATYTGATRIEGGTAEFAAIQPGTWFLVAEAEGLDAAFVRQVGLGESQKLTFNIELGRVTVRTSRDAGAAPPEGTRMTYSVALLPMGSGAMKSFYVREIPANAQTDVANFTLPAGSYTVNMGGGTDSLLAVEPPVSQFTLSLDGEINLAALLRAASTLEFMCIDGAFAPVPGVEFLVTFSPAGEIGESERPRIQLGGADGRCRLTGAPYGQVYLHLWISSRDLQKPDKSYVIDLPAYGVLNLGSVTVR